MQTRLNHFCRAFDKILRPLVAPVEHVVARLGDGSGRQPIFEGLPELREGHHRLKLLMEKIAQQQAYVLIFGPLKSGKSTLMNAITAAYVSEVTSLPAYPCLVYVSHSAKPEFQITRYDGSSESVTTSDALHRKFEQAHRDLSTHIRKFENARTRGGSPPSFNNGEDHFDPAIDFPQAIRKVDVKVPAGDLEASGAVLVDTPGLYCRMKFGYDQMTRDFRDTAACAVFVVKTDNLFLEQVFEEFQELLEIFGRIALVVNLDSTKRDLGPDGSLVPSLERENPQRIIEAFESLAMSAPLKAALDQGRLRIYPVDLLRAASERLRSAHGVTADEDEEIVHTGFEAFRRDMTEYLNSNEYFEAFRLDSLRYAEGLFERLETSAKTEEVTSIRCQVEQLRALAVQSERIVASHERLVVRDWEGSFNATRTEFEKRFEDRMHEILRTELRHVSEEIDHWFGSEHSLEDLTRVTLARNTVRAQEAMAMEVMSALRELAGRRDSDSRGGFELDETTASDLARAEITLDAALTDAATEATPQQNHEPVHHGLPFDMIPVRRRLGDWLLFRSKASLRQRLFGEASNPSKPISVAAKTKNLGSAGRGFLLSSCEDFVKDRLPRRLREIYQTALDTYLAAFAKPLVERCAERRTESERQLERDRARLEELKVIADSFTRLEKGLDEGRQQIDQLRASFATSADPTIDAPAVDQSDQTDERVEAV